MKQREGIVFLPIILIVLVIAGIILIPRFVQNQSTFLTTPLPEVSMTPTPTATPTATATAKPTIKPTASPTGSSTPKPVTISSGQASVVTSKGTFGATILSFNLGSTRVITDTASDSDCADNCPVMNLASYVSKNGGSAGVNGTYFCPATYPECSSKKNSFDFPVYNSRLNKWINAGNLSWNGRSMVYFDGGGAHYLQNANSFGGGLTAGIVNHPGLVDGGNVQIDENQSGLSDKQKLKGTKVGIGVKDSNNIIVVVASNVTMHEFAYVFQALGAKGALNLDTGGSTALYQSGRYLYGPGRDLPNAIIFASK